MKPEPTEFVATKNVNVYGQGCIGCQRHKRAVMVSFTTDAEHSPGIPVVWDLFLTAEQAESVAEQILETLAYNKETLSAPSE